MSSNYDVGTRAWQPDATEGWVASEVVNKVVDGSKVTLVFKLENEEVRTSPQARCRAVLFQPETRERLTRMWPGRRKQSSSRLRA